MNRLFLALLLGFTLHIRLLAADWLTFGHDPQRSGWAFAENQLSLQNVSGLSLKWKVQLKNEPKSLTALTVPVIASNITTAQGVKTLVFVAGSSNHFFAIDAETGTVIWTRTFDTLTVPKNEDMWLCPQGINATPTIDKAGGIIYAIALDGRLYGLDLGTGKVRFGPIQFVPPFSKNWSLNLVDGVIYTSISQGCGSAQSGLYSIDVRNPFRPLVRVLLVSEKGHAGIWGRGGPVIGGDRRVYGMTGDGEFDPANQKYGSSVIAASLKELELKDYFAPLNWRDVNKYDWDIGCTSPVWFAHRNRALLAGGGKEGVVYLMDTSELGGKDHHTPLFTTPRLGNDEDSFQGTGIWGGLSAWQDEKGDSWVYVPMWGARLEKRPKVSQDEWPQPER